MRGLALKTYALALAIALTAGGAWAANISVSKLELLTHGSVDSATGRLGIDSRLFFGMALEGGNKFAGLLLMDFLSGNMEKDLAEWSAPLPDTAGLVDVINRLNAASSMRLRTAAVTARRPLNLPLEATYFVGSMGAFCSGDDFVPLFGAAPFATEMRGPMQYPEGVGGDPDRFYDGIHGVYGTGLRLGTVGIEKMAGYLYLYQDADLGAGRWSGDIRALIDGKMVKIEAFLGGSADERYKSGLYRAGLLFHYAPGDVGEFYAQVGIPRWEASTAFSVDSLFFLFEPRVNFAEGSIALTVFYHPAYYLQRATNENGALDVGINVRIGQLSQSGTQGGVSSLIAIRPQSTTMLSVDIAPYYSFITSGVQWDFKLGIRPFPLPSAWFGIFRPFVGIKTSY